MLFRESDHRVIRKDAQGNRYEYSDSDSRPHGEGWAKVDPIKHPRARVYTWFRPYSAAVREYKKQPRLIDEAPKTLQISPDVANMLGAGFAEELNRIRNELRSSLSLEKERSGYFTGDRVRVKDKDGKEHVAYVQRVDAAKERFILRRAVDGETLVGTVQDMAPDFELGPVTWSKGDWVTVDGKAAGMKDKEVEGTIIGFDDFTNKLRVLVGSSSTIEIYPEAILGVRGKNPEILRQAHDYLAENKEAFNSPGAKGVLESLLRAVIEGRESVSAQELREDIKAVSGLDLSLGFVRGELGAISTLFRGGTKDGSLHYNPATDKLFLRDGFLAVRMVANSRDVKKKHKKFGWKNITEDNPNEAYAAVGTRVAFEEEGIGRVTGLIKRINGGRADVEYGGKIRSMELSDLKDTRNRTLLPDPTDPAAFGAINRNAFWLLRDREWCKDFRDGDVVSLLTSLSDPTGKRARLGEYGKVLGRSVDGRLTVEMNTGKKVVVTPRQLRQVRELSNLQQFQNRVDKDPVTVYGTTTVIKDGQGEARIAMGGERHGKFMNFMFPNLDNYLHWEQSMFEAVTDDVATQNRTRMIMPMNESVTDRNAKTLIPNESLFRILQKMYPTAKKVTITRQATVMPGTMRDRPDTDPTTQKYTRDEVASKVAARERPTGEDYFDPDNVQGGKRKSTAMYKDYYEPDDAGFVYDPSEDAYKPKNNAPPDSGFFSRLIRSNPFRKDATPVGPELTFSASDVDKFRKETPVTLRVSVDLPDAELKRSNGVTFEMPRIAKHFSKVDKTKPEFKTALPAEALDWGNRVRITTDANNVFIEVGKALAERPSLNFKDRQGNPMTFHQLATMSLVDKYSAWENPGGSPEDRRKLMNLLNLSSLLTYDKTHKRYRASLSNYAKVNRLLKSFFGDDGMESLVYEDLDGAFVFPAKEGRLAKEAVRYESEYIPPSAELPTDLLKGFNYLPLIGDETRDYQRKAVNFLLNNDQVLLANDQGTGKSATILAAIMGRVAKGQVRKTLIICPANLVAGSWPGEIEKWCKPAATVEKVQRVAKGDSVRAAQLLAKQRPSINYELLTTKTREDFFANMLNTNEPTIAVASYEMANLYGKELQRLGFDMVALDEAQNIKTGTTKTRAGSKRTETIKDVFVDVPVKIAATGTPIENSIDDLHSIVSWLNPTLLGPAEDFAQDFIETDYVVTGDGRKQAVQVAIKKPEELAKRLKTVFWRTSKPELAAKEREVTEAKLGKEYSSYLHYGVTSPRLVYPLVKIGDDGNLLVRNPNDTELAVPPHRVNHKDATLIDLKDSETRGKYKEYIAAIQAANQHFTQHYKGGITERTRYGQVNMKASAMLEKMQQALNDPYILSKDPEFASNPLFNNPKIANPKFDRLISILDKHCSLPYSNKTSLVIPTQEILDPKSKEHKLRNFALNETRGKTIVFCRSVEAMKALKRRLDEHPTYRGRALYYAGTENIGELMGVKGSGKQVQAMVRDKFEKDENYDILIANDAAQTGLNFPQANLVVNYELLWNPQAMNQRIDRAHRLGTQHRPVTAINIAVNDTVETQKLRAQAYKQSLFDAVIPKQEKVTQAEGQQEFVNSRQDLLKRKTFMGEDAAGLMDELINSDPTLKDLPGISEEGIMRSKFLKSLATNKKKTSAQRTTSRLDGARKFLARWW